MKIWQCKIGIRDDVALPSGADAPMRRAVSDAFKQIMFREDDFNFSGWGAELSHSELAVIDRSLPIPPTIRNATLSAIGGHLVVIGEIYGDTKGRFEDGSTIRTSGIVNMECFKGGAVVQTKNTFYRVELRR